MPQLFSARLYELQMFGPATVATAASVSAAGTTQATATPLPSQLNIVTDVPAGAGVIVKATPLFTPFEILNRGADALLVYPPSGAQLEANSINAPVSLAAGSAAHFVMVSATQGYVFL